MGSLCEIFAVDQYIGKRHIVMIHAPESSAILRRVYTIYAVL